MNTVEEIAIRLGIDTSQMQSGFGKAESEVGRLAGHIGKHLQRAFVMAPITEGIIDGIKTAVDVSSKYIAENLFNALYGTTEFSAKVLDSIRGTFRELNQKRYAEEAFNKELTEQIRLFGKLADEIASLEAGHAPDSIEGLGDKIRIARGELEHQESVYEDLLATMADSITVEDQAIKVAKAKLDLRKTEMELAEKFEDKQKKADEDNQKAQEKMNDLAAREAEIRNRMATEKQRGYEQFMPSLQELSQSGWNDMWGRFHGGPLSGIASNIMALGDRAKQAFINNNPGLARRLVDVRNERYDALAQAGIVPQRAEKAAEAQVKMADDIRAIKEGKVKIRVVPANGK